MASEQMIPLFERTEFYVVVFYLLLMIMIGLYFVRRNKGGLDFFAGGRAVPWWVSGISLYMGNFSAWLFTGGAGMIYKTTWYGLLYFFLTGAVSYLIGSQLTAVQWRRSRVISPVEFTRTRFGVGTQQMLGIITSVVFIAAAGNQLRAISSIVNSVLGIPLATAAVFIGVIVILYTLAGGLWAVMVTDVVQFVVLLSITLLIAPLAVYLVDGGLGGILATMNFSIPPPDGSASHDAHFLVAGLISFSLGVASGQGPRFYCVPDEKSARKVGFFAAALFLTTPILFSLPSLAARALWGGPDLLADHIQGPNPHEQVFTAIAMNVLPPGLVGIFLAAMFAATMSALDTVYNQVASVLSRDMYMHFKPDTTDHELIRVGRVMTLFIGIITIGLCLLYMAGPADLFTVMIQIFYLAAPVTAAPLLMGLLYRKAHRYAGVASMTWGIITGLVTNFLLHWPIGYQIYLTQAVCLGMFPLSSWLGTAWRARKPVAVATTLGLAAALTAFLLEGTPKDIPVIMRLSTISIPLGLTAHQVIWTYGTATVLAFLFFASRFAVKEDTRAVDEFYRRLDTPVDVVREVTGSREAALETFRFIGVLTFIIAALVLVVLVVESVLSTREALETGKYLGLAAILLFMGLLFMLGGSRKKKTQPIAN